MDNPPPLPKSRPRWPIFFAIGMAVMAFLVMGAISLLEKIKQREETKIATKALNQEVDAARESALQSEDGVTGSSERMNKIEQAISTLGNTMEGSDKKAMQAMQTIITDMRPPMQSYEAAFGKLKAVEFHSPEGLTGKPEIAARRALVEEFRVANEALAAYQANMALEARKRLTASGLSEKYINATIKGFTASSHLPQLVEIRAQDRQLCQLMFATLDLFEKHLGKWSYSEEGLLFEEDAPLAQYQKIQEQIVRVSDEQTRLQQQILVKRP